MAVDGEVLRMVMVLHDIRDYAHGYVDPAVRNEVNRALDAYNAPDRAKGTEESDLKGVLLALASEAETLARGLEGRPDADTAGPRDVFLATLASKCLSAIAAAG